MRRSALILAALWWMGGGGWARAGEPRQERLPWEAVGSRVMDKKVALVLPDGTHVEGKVIGVEREGLRLKVSKTSNRKTQPKGNHVIPREALSVLRVTEYRKIGRLLGTLGAVATAGGIVATKQIDLYEGPLTVVVPVTIGVGMVGSAIGGYYTGKAFDKKVVEIVVER